MIDPKTDPIAAPQRPPLSTGGNFNVDAPAGAPPRADRRGRRSADLSRDARNPTGSCG
jgi:hypothetical protein